MELKKPANPWELLPGAPKLNANKVLVSAIRINVNSKPETLSAEPTQPVAQTHERLFVPSATRAQTPLPTRRRHEVGRQILDA